MMAGRIVKKHIRYDQSLPLAEILTAAASFFLSQISFAFIIYQLQP